jgi:membrane protein implicated in regulation of membrane protease activity
MSARVREMALPWPVPSPLQTEKWPFEWQMITITILSTVALLAAWAAPRTIEWTDTGHQRARAGGQEIARQRQCRIVCPTGAFTLL